jgi:hypothetical protein
VNALSPLTLTLGLDLYFIMYINVLLIKTSKLFYLSTNDIKVMVIFLRRVSGCAGFKVVSLSTTFDVRHS